MCLGSERSLDLHANGGGAVGRVGDLAVGDREGEGVFICREDFVGLIRRCWCYHDGIIIAVKTNTSDF